MNTTTMGLNEFDVSSYRTHQMEKSLSNRCYRCQVPKILQNLPLLLTRSFCQFEPTARASFARPAFASSLINVFSFVFCCFGFFELFHDVFCGPRLLIT